MRTEAKYQVGDRFTKRGTRDAGVWEISEINWKSGSAVATYVLRRIAFLNGTVTEEFGEGTIDKIYIKIQ